MSFSFRERSESWKHIDRHTFDLVIIGGGITGAGIARDAASRGMKVALFEARDFAEGTSSRSSKLIHGGVRYLENLEFHLVFEALAERSHLFKMAPHLVHPLRFLIPIYKNSRVGYWKMLAGMWLYDLLALMDTPQMHESLGESEVLDRLPAIDSHELVGAMEYSDAYTDDDRLVIETLRDAQRMGAQLFNYTPVIATDRDAEEVRKIRVKEHFSGDEKWIQGTHFVSTVGPWTDIFGEQVDPQWKKVLRPTKGVHLVFNKERVPVSRAVVMAVEKRIIFVIPRHEMVIVGTTDTDFQGDPASVETNQEDVDYILSALNQYFPGLKVTQDDVLSSYAGVRPLVDDGSSTEGKTSREHTIWNHGSNLTFVAGGKYTTYRKISEEAVNEILSQMPFEKRMSFGKNDTIQPLNPLITESLFKRDCAKIESWQEKYSLTRDWQEKLLFRHGGEARFILETIEKKYAHYSSEEAYWMGEAEFAIENTLCMSLKDFYWRRTPLFLSKKDHGLSVLDSISHVFKEFFDWSAETMKSEKEKLVSELKSNLISLT